MRNGTTAWSSMLSQQTCGIPLSQGTGTCIHLRSLSFRHVCLRSCRTPTVLHYQSTFCMSLISIRLMKEALLLPPAAPSPLCICARAGNNYHTSPADMVVTPPLGAAFHSGWIHPDLATLRKQADDIAQIRQFLMLLI